MQVIDHEPQSWFLFEGTDNFVFNVNCEHSCVGYDFTIVLSAEETARYKMEGRLYLNRLAEEVNYSAPIARGSESKYKGRNAQSQYQKDMDAAVEKWREK